MKSLLWITIFSAFAATTYAGDQAGPGKTSVTKEVLPPPQPIEEDAWNLRIEPYLWATGLDGTTGANGFETSFSASFAEIFEQLEMAAALQLELRNDRWGILADGFYARLGDGGATPGPFYSEVEAEMEQFLGELAVAYRLADGDWGFVDIFAGARVNALSLDITSQISSSGIRRFSRDVVNEISDRVSDQVRSLVAAQRARLQSAIDDGRDVLEDRLEGIDGILPPGDDGRLPDIIRDRIKERIRERIEELAQARLEEAQAEAAAARARARRKIAKAKEKLEDEIAKAIEDRLPTSTESDKTWVDPFIGLRGQVNLTEALFLAARADIGGFGVSSELAYQLQVTLGIQVTRSFFTELGYRYLHTDYDEGGFVYNVEQAGAFLGLGFTY